jgi:hypothetical protein
MKIIWANTEVEWILPLTRGGIDEEWFLRWNIKRFIRSVEKEHIVQVNILSDFGAEIGVSWTLLAELYAPVDFFETAGESSATEDLSGVENDALAFFGVSRVSRMLTFPFVNSSAFTTSEGKFDMTLLVFDFSAMKFQWVSLWANVFCWRLLLTYSFLDEVKLLGTVVFHDVVVATNEFTGSRQQKIVVIMKASRGEEQLTKNLLGKTSRRRWQAYAATKTHLRVRGLCPRPHPATSSSPISPKPPHHHRTMAATCLLDLSQQMSCK